MKIYDDGDIRAYISTDLYSHPLRYCATLLGGEISNLDAYGKTPEESVKKLKNARNFRKAWEKKLQERKQSMTKRQSTTAKVTLQHVDRIEADIANGNGVLVRYRRQALGVIGVERVGKRVFFRVYETSALIPREGCTIPKATIDSWREGASVVLNVGRKVGKYGLLDDQFVQSRIAYGGVYNASKSFREDIGKWEGADEPTIIATGKTTISRAEILSSVEEHANELGQEAIAVEIDGVGILVWGERGKRNYSFDPAYFIR